MKLGFLMEGNEYSFARVVGFMLVVYWMVFSGKISLATNTFPDMPFGIISLVLLAYGINKTTEAVIANGNSKINLTG